MHYYFKHTRISCKPAYPQNFTPSLKLEYRNVLYEKEFLNGALEWHFKIALERILHFHPEKLFYYRIIKRSTSIHNRKLELTQHLIMWMMRRKSKAIRITLIKLLSAAGGQK